MLYRTIPLARIVAILILIGSIPGLRTSVQASTSLSTYPSQIEADRNFRWAEVPSTRTNPDPGNPDTTPEPWYVDLNTLMYQGELVVFETASPDARYILFRGHCPTHQLRAIYEGEFLDATRIIYRPSLDDWHQATGWQSALLEFACTNAPTRLTTMATS